MAMKRDQPKSRLAALPLEIVFRNHPSIMLLTDPETGAILDANLAAESFYGYTRQQLQTKKLTELRAGDLQSEFQSSQEAAVQEKRDSQVWPYRLANGQLRWMEEQSTSFSMGGKNCYFSVFMDVTEQQEMKAALLKSEAAARKKGEDLEKLKVETCAEYQQALIDNFPFLVWLKDEHSRFLAVNKPFAQACGLGTPEAVVGKTDLDVWPIELAESYRADDRAVLESGRPKNVEEIIEQSGQPPAWFETYKSPVQVNDRMVGTVGFSRDITEKQRLLEAAQRTQKLESLSVLAGGIAHDFNNLLSGIFGCLDLARDASGDPKVSDYLDSALGSLERARALTHQLLTFAKGGAPVRKILPLGSCLKETANFALSGSNVSYILDIAPDLKPVEFDKNQLGQVMDNLLINAQQAMPTGGEVVISAKNISLHKGEHATLPPGEYVRVMVADQGVGIAQEILPRIFDPFFTTKPKGSGLGLTTCYSIMNRHHGSVEVDSELGRGSKFYLYLPASLGAYATEPEAERTKGALAGKILFMDDEEGIRDIVDEMLKCLGHSCVSAANGMEAVSLFTQAEQNGQPFAAVILDLTVPGGMGGKEAAALIRRYNPRVPLVVSSGYAEDPVIASPREYGFSGSLRKPFVMSELKQVLDELAV